MLHMYGEWEPLEQVDGNLEALDSAPDIPFHVTSWVGDRPQDLVPDVLIRRPHEKIKRVKLDNPQLRQLEDNNARKVFHYWGRVPESMLVLDVYVYIYSSADAVRMEGTFTNSDPSSKEIDETFEFLGIETGEFFSLDYREHYGLNWPNRTPSPHWNWQQAIAMHRTLADGQQIPFSGWFLCLPTPPDLGLDLANPITQLRIDSLRAYMTIGNIDMKGGDVLAMSEWHEGSWQAFGSIPQIPKVTGHSGLDFFKRIHESQIDIYDQRPDGLAKRAGQTGGQQDFGACQGGQAINFLSVHSLERLRYMVTDFFRPFHNRQPDGKAITKESNPQLWTWSQLPIGTTSPPPPDDLGKGFQGVWPPGRTGTGYSGIDDQHRSTNTFHASYALSGSHLLEALLYDFYQIDRTQVPGRVGAPRAIGRLFQSWAGAVRLLQPTLAGILRGVMWTKFQVLENGWVGKNVPRDRPIRVIGTGSDPSLTNPDGTRKHAWIVWEHAIATMGLYAASLQTEGIESDAYARTAEHFAKLVTEYGCFYDGVNWRCCTSVEYLGGEDEGNPVSYGLDSDQINISDSFWQWTLPAVIICERFARDRKDTQLLERCQAIIDQVQGEQPVSWNASHWWAV
jgi:hypothetical protein